MLRRRYTVKPDSPVMTEEALVTLSAERLAGSSFPQSVAGVSEPTVCPPAPRTSDTTVVLTLGAILVTVRLLTRSVRRRVR